MNFLVERLLDRNPGTVLSEKIDCCHSSAPGHDDSCDCGSCEPETQIDHQRLSSIPVIIEAAFLLLSVGLLLMGDLFGLQSVVGDLSISFVAIMVEAVPFLLIGSLIGGIVEEFVSKEILGRLLGGRQRFAIFIGASLGLIIPLCDCAMAPLIRRLLNKGVPLSVAIALLLAGPIVNPIVAASTWVAYKDDWSFLFTRMLFGYLVAVVVAFCMKFLFRGDETPLIGAHLDSELACDCCRCGHGAEKKTKIEERFFLALQHSCNDFFNIGKFLVIGAFVAALARTVIGVNVLSGLASSPVAAIILMMLLAMVLNLCSQTDAFIAAGFRGILPDTAQMAFMILGPMLDIKLLLLYPTMFRKRVIFALVPLTFLTVLTSMIFLEYGLGGLIGGW